MFAFEGGLHLALHLMIAGRLHWKGADAPIPKSNGLMAVHGRFGKPAEARPIQKPDT